jgi:hypothetical protein
MTIGGNNKAAIVTTMYLLDDLSYFASYGTHPVGFETGMAKAFNIVISA